MISICTLFDSRFSIEGWLLWKSINKLNKYIKFYILCMDERAYLEAEFLSTKCGDIFPIRLYDFENHFPELLKVRGTRPWAPYTQTCKVFLPTYIFDKYNEKLLSYVDSDLYFWNNPEEIEKEIGDFSFMVAPREEEPPQVQGRYNGGFYACRDTCEEFLRWWQNKTIEWCLWEKGENGRFGEEGYLNIFYDEPNKFSGIKISSHPGINLAYWNIKKHKLELKNNNIIIDKKFNLVCFHYQGLRIFKSKYESFVSLDNEVVKYIYDSYYKEYISFKEEFLNELDCYWRR